MLCAWARERGLILPSDFAPLREGGREHDVFHDSTSRNWIKVTKPNQAGYFVEIIENEAYLFPATPLQYLDRWRAHNAVFSDDVDFVGVIESDAGNRIAVVQADSPGESPSWRQIDDLFVNKGGYSRLDLPRTLGGYEALAYFDGRIGIFDVRPANCVLSADGLVIPIDVIPQFFNRRDADVLKNLAVKL